MESIERRNTFIRLKLLDQVLSGLTRTKGMHLSPQNEAELRKKEASMLWDILPSNVASINLGEKVIAEKSEDQLQGIAPNQRETWDLSRVDQFAASLAQQAREIWIPKF